MRPGRRELQMNRQISCLVLASLVFLPGSSRACPSNSPWTCPERESQTPAIRGESFEQLKKQAETALKADQIPEAIRLYDRATQLQPSWSEGWWHLGTLLFDADHYAEARDAFAHFVTVERKQPGPGFAMLGLTEFELKDYEKAVSALEIGVQKGLGTDPTFNRSVLYHDAILNTLFGKPEIALKRLTLAADQIAAANPANPKEAALADSELLDAFGIAALRLRKLPADLAPEQGALVRMVGHAQALVAVQDRAAASTEFKDVVSRFDSAPGVHYLYGVFLLKEDPAHASEEFQKEAAISPSDAAPWIQLALGHLRGGEYQEGLPCAKKATELAPDDFVAHVAYGRLWMELGNAQNAIRELQTAVKLAPGSPDAHFALARALSRGGRAKDAEREQAEFERLKALADAENQNGL